jgi:hypothetical protein
MSNRRSEVRYDVVGAMWGQLELHDEARLRNVSVGGALLESPMAAALDSTQIVQLAVEGQQVAVEARVRHVTELASDRTFPKFLIGVEFVAPPTSVLQSIELFSGIIPAIE